MICKFLYENEYSDLQLFHNLKSLKTQVMPFVVDHCSRGFVSHVVVTGSEISPDDMSPEDEERFQRTLSLFERINPRANVILAPRGQFQSTNDFMAILRDVKFDSREMGKMRHLLFPGWWDREDDGVSRIPAENGAGAAMGAKVWPHEVTSMAFRFTVCLDKKKLARELKMFKAKRGYPGCGGDGRPTGVIFIVTGELKFEKGGKVSCLNYSAVADKLTCIEREEEEDKEEDQDETNTKDEGEKKAEREDDGSSKTEEEVTTDTESERPVESTNDQETQQEVRNFPSVFC